MFEWHELVVAVVGAILGWFTKHFVGPKK